MTTRPDLDRLGRHEPWDGVRAVIAGFGPCGYAAADNLLFLGAGVIALDEVTDDSRQERAQLLETLGAQVRLEPGATAILPDEVDLVVVPPELDPASPLLDQAAERGLPMWSDVELAWRLREPGHDTPWLAITGAVGATTTARMLGAILVASGLRGEVAGIVGRPIVEVVMDPDPYDVVAVALTNLQLKHTTSMAAESAAVLNVEPAASGTARIYEGVRHACVYNLAEPLTEEMVREADVTEGARAVGFTLGMPAVGNLGVVEDLLVDRAFIEERATSAAELCTLDDLASQEPQFVANALAAAGLARAHGVSQQAVRDGLRAIAADSTH